METVASVSERGSEEPIGPWEPFELEQEVIIETTPIVLALGGEFADEIWQEFCDFEEKDGVFETYAPLSIVGLTKYMGVSQNTWGWTK